MQLKYIGSTMILIGTAIGAGMLALPMVSAINGFWPSALIILGIWLLMMLTGLLVLEVNMAFPLRQNNFNSMALATLGRGGQIVAWCSCLLLLYALTAAYIAGMGSLLTELLQTYLNKTLDPRINSFLFLLIFGGFVYWSTGAVDHINRWLISFKGVFLILMLVMLLPHVNVTALNDGRPAHMTLLAAIPIFLTAFGYHTVIPSLTNYVGKEVKVLHYIIIIGTFIPLVLYLLWLVCALGIVPLNDFVTLKTSSNNSVGGFIHLLDQYTHHHAVTFAINGFANIAMTTSFLGVSLGLFDFLADGFKHPNTRLGRMRTALLTFTIPFAFAIFYPKGFILALSYAAISLAVLGVVLPALMAYRLRKTSLAPNYRVIGGTPLLVLITLIGIALVIIGFKVE
jgi:aromatic amino acid transport protein